MQVTQLIGGRGGGGRSGNGCATFTAAVCSGGNTVKTVGVESQR